MSTVEQIQPPGKSRFQCSPKTAATIRQVTDKTPKTDLDRHMPITQIS